MNNQNFLSQLSPQEFYYAPIPLKALLESSAYYPGCGFDAFPIIVANTKWRHLGIDSFIMCDFGVKVSEIQHGRNMKIDGYHCVTSRVISPKEYIPKGWKLNLFEVPAETYHDRRFPNDPRVRRSAVWQIYQRYSDNEALGPEMISVLFVIGEGFATYHQLYYHHNIPPKLLFFVQYCDMCGPMPNWEGRDSLFYRMIQTKLQCAPEWVVSGCHNDIDYGARIRNGEEFGVRIIREYEHEEILKNCQERKELDRTICPCRGWIYQNIDKRIICLDVCRVHILYEVINKNRSVEEILKDLILPPEKCDVF
jgi:hypothetical protein